MADELIGGAAFSEVIDVELQPSEFQKGLDTMLAQYERFIKELESKGADPNAVLGTAGVSSLEKTIASLQKEINGLGKSISGIFGEIEDESKQAAASVQRDVDKITAAAREAEESKLNMKRTARERVAQINAQVQQDEQDHLDKIARMHAAERDRQARNAERSSSYSSFDGRGALGREAAQRFGTGVSSGRLSDAELRGFSGNIAAQLQQSMEQQVAAEEEALSRRSSARRKAAEEDDALFQKETTRQQARLAGMKTVEQELDKLRIKNAEAAELAKRTQGGAGGFFSGIKSGFSPIAAGEESGAFGWGEALGNVARFYAEWQLVALAAEAAGEALKLPFEVVKNGFDELKQHQEAAAQLRGALSDSIVFSDKPADNLKLAAQAADQLTFKIEDLADRLHVKQATIQSAFATFLDFGGRNLTGNVEEGVGVAGLAAAALQSQNPNIQTRTINTQLQRLVSGTLKDADKLPAALGVSADKLNDMAHHAQKTHDLLQRIQEAAPGLVQRLALANPTLEQLEATASRLVARFEGLVAQPLFERVIGWLQQMLNWVNENWDSIKGLGEAWGKMLDSIVAGLTRFDVHEFDLFKEAVKDTLLFASQLGMVIAKIANDLGTILTVGAESRKFLTDPKDASSSIRNVVQQHRETNADIDDAYHTIQDILNGKKSTDSGPSIPNGKSKNGILGGKDIDALKKELADRLDLIKKTALAETEAIDRGEKLKTTAVEQGEARRQQILKQELVDILNARADTFSKFGSGDRTKNVFDFDKANRDDREAILKKIEESKDKQVLNRRAISATGDKSDYDLALADSKQRLDDMKKFLEEGVISNVQYNNQERLAEERNFQLYQDYFQKRREAAMEDVQKRAELDAEYAVKYQEHVNRLEQIDQQSHGAFRKDITVPHEIAVDQANLRVQGIEFSQQLARSSGQYSNSQDDAVNLLNAQIEAVGARTRAENAKSFSPQEIKEDSEAYRQHKKVLEELSAEEDHYYAQLVRKTANGDAGGFFQTIFGSRTPFSEEDKTTGKTQFSLAQSFKSLTEASKNLQGAFDTIYTAFRERGALAGISATASAVGGGLSAIGQSTDGSLGKTLGQVGGAVALVGALGSFLSDIFTRAAVKIGQEISKSVQHIMEEYQTKQITLIQTIQQIENQRNSAIAQLAGKKGGSKVLEQLLPQLDQQIASLQSQAQQVKTTFEQNVLIASQNNDVTKQWLTDWIGINQQVQQYLGAVGDTSDALQQATTYLNQMLAAQRLQLNTTLNQDQQQAIQDAINLNNLLLQRNQAQLDYQHSVQQLNLSYQQTYAATVGGNSLERRGDPTLDNAKKLAQVKSDFEYQMEQLQTQHEQQMTNLNAEIDQLSVKVNIERQLFGIAQDTNTLEQEALQASLFSLQQYAQQVQAIQSLLDSTSGVTASNGQFPGSPFFPNIFPYGGLGPIPGQSALSGVQQYTAGTNVGVINVNVDGSSGDPDQIGSDIADALDYELRTRGRYQMHGA